MELVFQIMEEDLTSILLLLWTFLVLWDLTSKKKMMRKTIQTLFYVLLNPNLNLPRPACSLLWLNCRYPPYHERANWKPNDSFGLVTFESQPHIIQPLTKCSEINVPELEDKIKAIHHRGGTNITPGNLHRFLFDIPQPSNAAPRCMRIFQNPNTLPIESFYLQIWKQINRMESTL